MNICAGPENQPFRQACLEDLDYSGRHTGSRSLDRLITMAWRTCDSWNAQSLRGK
jgi:hypothetical protein